MVMGTSVGFTKVLTLIGVGYRASLANNVLTLNLGFSHPVVIPVPKDITVLVCPQTRPRLPLSAASHSHQAATSGCGSFVMRHFDR